MTGAAMNDMERAMMALAKAARLEGFAAMWRLQHPDKPSQTADRIRATHAAADALRAKIAELQNENAWLRSEPTRARLDLLVAAVHAFTPCRDCADSPWWHDLLESAAAAEWGRS